MIQVSVVVVMVVLGLIGYYIVGLDGHILFHVV